MTGGEMAGRVALVTGGGRGIGAAIARALAVAGATVAVADIAGADALARTLAGEGLAAEAHRLDVSDDASIAGVIDAVVGRHGGIDVLVNAAGIFHAAALADTERADWRRVFEVNVIGLAAMIAATTPHMIGRKHGRVINIASIGGRRADEKTPVYSASKAAVISITQSAALDLIRHGIAVNAIAPGPVATAMWQDIDRDFSRRYLGQEAGAFSDRAAQATPAGRIADPEDIASVALFLASGASGHVIGQTINVDGGVMLN